MKKAICFGAGHYAELLYPEIKKGYDILAFVDNNSHKWGQAINGTKICNPGQCLRETSYDAVIVTCAADRTQIDVQLHELGVPQEKIDYSYLDLAPEIELSWGQKNTHAKNQVVYYPIFDNGFELTSHYYRACWYLPQQYNHLTDVFICKKNCDITNCIDYMGRAAASTEHIHVVDADDVNYEDVLKESKIILVWKDFENAKQELSQYKASRIINVTTNDPTSREYAEYCKIIWENFKTPEERQEIIATSRRTFLEVADEIKKLHYSTACICCTGPSIEKAWQFDFSDCVSVVCNSIVQNKEMLDHIRPRFVTAGDVVSHSGVSKYAEVFRHDLISVLLNTPAYFVSTAPWSYILLEHHPQIAEKTILLYQTRPTQNPDLCEDFRLPTGKAVLPMGLSSTFNIHMVPLANTFANNIFIIGSDGKIPKADNEDFWAHSDSAQYKELVATGHKSHPMFDVQRQKAEYQRHNDAVRYSITVGEEEFGKKYYSLTQSYLDGLRERKISPTMNYVHNIKNQILIAKLCDDY